MKPNPSPSSNCGFTLVEMLIYMLLFGIVMTGIYSVFISNVRSHKSHENTMAMVQDLRGSVDVMVREIRMACFDINGAGAGFVADADDRYDTDSNSIHFTMDLDENGDVTGTNENINYYLYTTGDGVQAIGRNVNGANAALAENITAMTFAYFDASGNPLANTKTVLADREAIRSVQITIAGETGDVDPNTGAKKTRTLTTRVRVRNAGL